LENGNNVISYQGKSKYFIQGIIGVVKGNAVVSSQCEVLVQGADRCKHCTTLFKNYVSHHPPQKQQNKRSRDLTSYYKSKYLKEKEKKTIHTSNNLALHLNDLITKQVITEESFFYKLLLNFLRNAERCGQGKRYEEEVIQFCCLIKFHGGKQTLNLLRGNEKIGLNLSLPSDREIRRYLPQSDFGEITEDKVRAVCNISSDCNDLIVSYDEMEIRSGLVFDPRTKKVVGFCGISAQHIGTVETPSSIDEKIISSKVIQFFVSRMDGSSVAPICFYGHQETKEGHINQVIQVIDSIKNKIHQQDPKLKIRAISSDRFDGNLVAGSKLKEQNIYQVFDYWHIIKNLRTAALESIQLDDGCEFGLYLLRDIKSDEKYKHKISEEYYSPSDPMNTHVIEEMMNSNISENLLVDQRIEYKNLGRYIKFMSDFKTIFASDDTISRKIHLINCLESILAEWFSVELIEDPYSQTFPQRIQNHSLFTVELLRDILITLNSIKAILSNAQNYKPNTASLSSNYVENFFSTIRQKIRYVNFYQYACLSRYVSISLNNRYTHEKSFTYSGFQSKSYPLAEGRAKYQPLKFQPTRGASQDPPSQAQKEKVQLIIEKYKPRKRVALVRDIRSKTVPNDYSTSYILRTYKNRVEVVCPLFTECGRRVGFRNHASFEKHLILNHEKNRVEAKSILYGQILQEFEVEQENNVHKESQSSQTEDSFEFDNDQIQAEGTQSDQEQSLTDSQDDLGERNLSPNHQQHLIHDSNFHTIHTFSPTSSYEDWDPGTREREIINRFSSEKQLFFVSTKHVGMESEYKMLEITLLAVDHNFDEIKLR
jgi:uncharacterized CHY-type Zn-finger protein